MNQMSRQEYVAQPSGLSQLGDPQPLCRRGGSHATRQTLEPAPKSSPIKGY
jgi:hypothetical protein